MCPKCGNSFYVQGAKCYTCGYDPEKAGCPKCGNTFYIPVYGWCHSCGYRKDK